MTNADRLALFPAPLRLDPSPWPNVIAILFSALLLGRCTEFQHQGLVWTGILFFVPIILISLLTLIPGSSSLVLRNDALVLTSFFRRQIVPWSQIRDFAAYGDDYRYRHVKYRDDSRPDPIDKRFGHRNNSLSGYKLSIDELAGLLTQWRELALNQPASQGQAASPTATATPEIPALMTPLSKNAADILAQFPAPQFIYRELDKVSVRIFLIPIALACVFIVFIIPIVDLLKAALPFAIFFAGVYAFSKWRNESNHIALFPEGMEIARGTSRERYTWDAVRDFIPVRNGSPKRVAFNRDGQPRIWLLERLDRPSWTVSGTATCVLRSSMLPSNYSVPDPELATLLTEWRERALAAQPSSVKASAGVPSGAEPA